MTFKPQPQTSQYALALASMTPHELGLCDFAFFTETFLGLPLWACQRRWCDSVQWAIEDSSKDGILIMAPADHGKTSRCVIPLILWLHARDRNNRIIFAMNLDSYAEQVGRAWSRRIEKTKVLSEKYGLVKGDKWSGQEYVLARDNWEDKDASLACLGVGSEIQSQRADYLILDDIATRRNSSTIALREKIASWVFTDAKSRLDKTREAGGKMIVFGHRVDPQDIYAQLEQKENWVVIKDRAIMDDATRTILAPEGHSYEKLCEQRSDDPAGFALLFQQQPVATGIYVTRQQFEHLKNRELKMVHNIPDVLRTQFVKIVMSLDPAFSISKWARFAVLGVWGISKSSKPTLLYGLREKTAPDTLIEICKAKMRVYQPDEFYIEGNTAQSLLIPVLRREFPWRAEHINSVYTLNPDGRLDAEIAKMFEKISAQPPMIELPYGDAASQSFTDALQEEVCNYPNYKFRDALMMWYIMEKGMGLIKLEERKAFFPPRGVVGSVSQTIRGYHALR